MFAILWEKDPFPNDHAILTARKQNCCFCCIPIALVAMDQTILFGATALAANFALTQKRRRNDARARQAGSKKHMMMILMMMMRRRIVSIIRRTLTVGWFQAVPSRRREAAGGHVVWFDPLAGYTKANRFIIACH
jgi:hypothetical protein